VHRKGRGGNNITVQIAGQTLVLLGAPETLLQRLRERKKVSVRSFSHGDTATLLRTAIELDIISIINKHIPANRLGQKPQRDRMTVGASLLLAAIGRACHPTSKMGWYEWCRETSLEYCLKTSFKKLDSQHFWEQMDFLPVEKIPVIEEAILRHQPKDPT